VVQTGFGYLRATLGAGRCDALFGLPQGNPRVEQTLPYYRSGWMFVTRADRDLDIRSFDDPRLRRLRIGAPVAGDGADTPALIALGRRRLAAQLRLYALDDRGSDDAVARMVGDVASGALDVAVAWGPAAGWQAARQPAALRLTPTPPQDDGIAMTSAIAVAVKRGNLALRDELQDALAQRRADVDAILAQFHVPAAP
jgi:mxaJ protein